MTALAADRLRQVIIAVIIAAVLFGFAGCGVKERSLSTGEVIPASQLPLAGFTPDTHYAVFRSSAMPGVYDDFRQVLFDQGRLTKWDSRFDCNHIASLYIAVAQAQYAGAAWHSSTKAQTLALGEVWYRIGGNGGGHAIVVAVTDSGQRFIEPQTGRFVTLNQAEKDSIFFVRW